MKSAVLIPTLNPEAKLCALIEEIQRFGIERIIVVDDGSDPEKSSIFEKCEQMHCMVVHHNKNYGKGAAIRTGIRFLREHFSDLTGVVTADGDGQHAPEDIGRIIQALEEEREEIILGVRDFSGDGIPFRSRIGNHFSSLFFRISNGIACPDTQTGLRGIPQKYFDYALSVEGDRYEYEMNFLCTAVQNKIPLHYIAIQTIYEDSNSGSHFNPVKDSLRIYARPIRFALASLSSWFIDIVLFMILSFLLKYRTVYAIFIAAICARLISGIYNFWLNRNWSFSKKSGKWGSHAVRYLIIFIVQMLTSAGLVGVLAVLPMELPVIKIIVDTCLFFISYRLQRDWVFRK